MCTSCPSHASTNGTGSIANEQCVCDGGYHGDLGGECTPCAANWFCAGGRANLCPYYTVSSNLSSKITDCTCEPGFWSTSGNSPCSMCPAGFYCPGGTVKTECPEPGENLTIWWTNIGAKSSSECNWTGTPPDQCPDGTYNGTTTTTEPPGSDVLRRALDYSVCLPCPANSFCTGGAILPCPGNSSSVQGMPIAEACQCNPGYYGAPGEACAECEADSYCDGARNYSCPLNSKSPRLSTAVTFCSCPAAYSGADGTACIPCQAGSWCDDGASTDCHDDSDSAYMSSAVTSCICDAGFTGDDGVDPCNGCINGTYKTSNGSDMCTLCRAGTWSWLVEAINNETCVECPLNSDSVAGSHDIAECKCKAGYTGSDGGKSRLLCCTTCFHPDETLPPSASYRAMSKLRSWDMEGVDIIQCLYRVRGWKVFYDIGSYCRVDLPRLPCKLNLVCQIRLEVPVLLHCWLLWSRRRGLCRMSSRQVQDHTGLNGVHEMSSRYLFHR